MKNLTCLFLFEKSLYYNSHNEKKTKNDIDTSLWYRTDRTIAAIIHVAVPIKKKITLNTEKKKTITDK